MPLNIVGVLRAINKRLVLFGVDFTKTISSLRTWPVYRAQLGQLKKQAAESTATFPLGTRYPCLGEDSSDSGVASGHYFHQDLLVARRINQAQPSRHIDVGSRVDGFVAHVAASRPIEVLDIRPLQSDIPNVSCLKADLMLPLDGSFIECCDSLSCLHALEHFGLGRYGDPVNFEGHVQGFHNLARIVKSDGTLYLSVPIGPQRIEFNAHRVFSVKYVLDLVADLFMVERFSYVDDSGDLHEAADLSEANISVNFGCHYGCGIFELRKR